MSHIDVAVVTGASRGIGRATALALAREGSHVVAAARTSEDLEALEAEAGASGGRITGVVADVSAPADVERVFSAAEAVGDVGALVCAAAVLHKSAFAELDDDTWRRSLDVNLTGTFFCCRRAFHAMRNGGRIVTIASLSGVYPTEKFPGLAAYNVSKYGVIGLTESVAVEGRERGISAICLAPGAVDTRMLREAAPHLEPRLGPRDVAETILALLSDGMVAASGAVVPLFSNA